MFCQDVRPYTYGSLTGKNSGVWGVHAKHNQAKPCNTKQNHVMPKSSNAKKTVQNKLLLQVHTCTPCSSSIFSAQNREKTLFFPTIRARMIGENAAEQKKLAPQKKNGKLGKTTTADHGGRGRRRPGSHGADGAVVPASAAALYLCRPSLHLPRPQHELLWHKKAGA